MRPLAHIVAPIAVQVAAVAVAVPVIAAVAVAVAVAVQIAAGTTGQNCIATGDTI